MSLDVIGNFLTIIRNGIMRSKLYVSIPYSRVKFHIATLLKDEGFIRDVQVEGEGALKVLKISLKYVGGESVIHEITRISTPGGRVYRSIREFDTVAGGLGIAIVTTNKGIMTNKRARELYVGGEILCTVW